MLGVVQLPYTLMCVSAWATVLAGAVVDAVDAGAPPHAAHMTARQAPEITTVACLHRSRTSPRKPIPLETPGRPETLHRIVLVRAWPPALVATRAASVIVSAAGGQAGTGARRRVSSSSPTRAASCLYGVSDSTKC